jgi:hypothetical protein
LENDIITKAPWNSPWNAPILPTPPKTEGGSCRVCFDGRGINSITVDNPGNIIPKIKDIQENLGNFKWITTLDLEKYYFQFPIKEEDQIKTTFTWRGTKYMYKRMPFGLKGASYHAQQVIANLLAPLQKIPYLDDIHLADTNAEEHIKTVLEVLKLITYKAGLRLNIKKCKFFRKEAVILGTLVKSGGTSVLCNGFLEQQTITENSQQIMLL